MLLDDNRQMEWIDEQPGAQHFKSTADFLWKYPIPPKPNSACMIHGESDDKNMIFHFEYNGAWIQTWVYHIEQVKVKAHTFDIIAI